jgi:O-antigen/teichoic acid export membrane protein
MGEQYGNAVFYLRVLSIVSVVVCLNIPGTLILLAMDQKKTYFRIYGLATIFNVLVNIVLAGFFEAAGTVMTIFITEIFITMALTRAVYQKKIMKGKVVDIPLNEIS